MNSHVILFVIVCCGCGVKCVDLPWAVNEHHATATKYGDMSQSCTYRRSCSGVLSSVLTPAQMSRYASGSSPLKVRGGAVLVENSYNRWPNNTVPFHISPQYSTANRQFLRTSLAALEAVSCFKFSERSTEADYVYIAPLDGCYSFVGRTGGKQPLSLSMDCLADYIVWHEMLHVLGFEHEHQRPDRDQYISVKYQNVQPGQMVNFEKLKNDAVELNEPYDYRSIMHYDGHAFGRFESGRRLATMIPLKKGLHLIDNLSFSETDLKKLRELGNCKQAKEHHKSECTDFSPICMKVAKRGFCKNEKYYNMIKDDCRKSCGWCESNMDEKKSKNSLPEVCVDEMENCEKLAAHGYCTNPFYVKHRSKCAKSCQLCYN